MVASVSWDAGGGEVRFIPSQSPAALPSLKPVCGFSHPLTHKPSQALRTLHRVGRDHRGDHRGDLEVLGERRWVIVTHRDKALVAESQER